MQDETIVYRPDYRKENERRLTRAERHKNFVHNIRKANAPAKCWSCIHFAQCGLNRPSCDRWKDETIYLKKEK